MKLHTKLQYLAFGQFLLFTAAVAQSVDVAGLRPNQRPVGAPVIERFEQSDAWRAKALTGIGAPQTGVGFLKDQGAWYYHEASGAQASGWVFSGARWYYLSPDSGVMVTGWVQVGSTWYYLSPDSGAMATGWLKEGGYWYYLQPGSGAMVTGWLKIWGTWYHFADNGQLIS